jgi:glucose-1-phosphate cytidylyltransferase
MELVIFAGGLGTRISEETDYIPKPMVKIGNKPILWHIIKYYSVFKFSDFIICGGYKINNIKNYFRKFKKITILILKLSTQEKIATPEKD